MDKDLNKNLVTVVLPVFNGSEYLADCITSLLNQTYKGFELLIIDDGSTDNSVEIIKQFDDPRIRLVQFDINKGLIAALNHGINMVKTRYLVRMDADDLAEPNRLGLQVELMESKMEIGVSSGAIAVFGDYNETWHYPQNHETISANLLFENKIAHPAVIIRTSVLRENGIDYSGPFEHLEDFYLWHRLKSKTKFHNLRSVLIRYRMQGQNITVKNKESEADRVIPLVRYILNELGIQAGDELCRLHYYGLTRRQIPITKAHIALYRTHLTRIIRANKVHQVYDQTQLKRVVRAKWDQTFTPVLKYNSKLVLYFWLRGKSVKFWQIIKWIRRNNIKPNYSSEIL